MLSKKLTVVNPSGLHLRPAGVLSQAAMKFKSDVIIECGEINLICDGEDEEAAMEALSAAIESGLGEK